MLAGIIARPRATSLRTTSGSSFSRLATYSISSVITPSRARCICDMFRLPFAFACAASRFSTQLSRIAINPPRTVLRVQPPKLSRNPRQLRTVRVKLWHRWRVTTTKGATRLRSVSDRRPCSLQFYNIDTQPRGKQPGTLRSFSRTIPLRTLHWIAERLIDVRLQHRMRSPEERKGDQVSGVFDSQLFLRCRVYLLCSCFFRL